MKQPLGKHLDKNRTRLSNRLVRTIHVVSQVLVLGPGKLEYFGTNSCGRSLAPIKTHALEVAR